MHECQQQGCIHGARWVVGQFVFSLIDTRECVNSVLDVCLAKVHIRLLLENADEYMYEQCNMPSSRAHLLPLRLLSSLMVFLDRR